ncbi:MAG TPA: hypothetical protein VKP60_22830 [Magnetospirillaceae bacterium]|nr:hypothetical protein [Magnetospirillaceae bacterium]
MTITPTPTHLPDAPLAPAASGATESSASAVSWPAIFAGAVVAAALALILIGLGAGLGFASVSPWTGGPSAAAFTIVAGIWLIVTQWLSAGVGGYVTGRLRTRWVGVHTHEVFFRDTAHGLVSWALAAVVGAGLLVAAGASALGSGARLAGGAAKSIGEAVQPYDADLLLRRNSPETSAAAGGNDQHGEVLHILTRDATMGQMPAEDRDYLVHVVAARTGVTQDEAQKRVDQILAQVKDAADKARKSAAAFALFGAFSMLIGAFISAAAAALGGQQRDEHPV